MGLFSRQEPKKAKRETLRFVVEIKHDGDERMSREIAKYIADGLADELPERYEGIRNIFGAAFGDDAPNNVLHFDAIIDNAKHTHSVDYDKKTSK